MNDLIKVDLHIHTRMSKDASSSLSSIIKVAKRCGLQGVAITDHDVFPEEMHDSFIKGLRIIWGEEVATREGEIIGLFLKQQVLAGLSPEETISVIKEQGGVTYLPHPLKQSGTHSWSQKTLKKILPLIDVVEVFNGRLLDPELNRRAERLAVEAGMLMGAGSDAHTPWEVGRAFVEMSHFDSPASFLAGLRQARIYGRPPSRVARLMMNRFVRKGLRRLFLAQDRLLHFGRTWPLF